MRSKITTGFLVTFGVVLIVLSSAPMVDSQQDPQLCAVPPVVGFGTKPNVMLVMDFSGSMQFPSYYPYSYGSTNNNVYQYNQISQKEYYPTITYYGNFSTDLYYKYDTSDSSNPYFAPVDRTDVAWLPFTAVSADASGAGGGIWFYVAPTGDATDIQVGDVVAFQGLSSHKDMNAKEGGGGYVVVERTATAIRVKYTRDREGNIQQITWSGKADRADGSVTKRIAGDIATGLSGNLLNFAATSRMDAALKALVGGKADCPSGDYCYVRSQSCQRALNATVYVAEDNPDTTGTNETKVTPVRFDLNPGTLSNPNYWGSGSYRNMDQFMDVSAYPAGYLDANDPDSALICPAVSSCTSQTQCNTQDRCAHKAEVWQFTLTASTQVRIRMIGVDGDPQNSGDLDPYLLLYSSTGPSDWTPVQANLIACCDDEGGNYPHAYIQTTLGPGTYLIECSQDGSYFYDQYGAYTLESNVDLIPNTPANNPVSGSAAHNGVPGLGGTLTDARVRVKIPKTERRGVINNAFDRVRFGFIYYKGTESGLIVRCDNEDMDYLTGAMTGSLSGTEDDQVFPWNGTPTRTGLGEAWDYYQTTGTHDPYKDKNGDTLSCRRSYVLLISDGEWNNGGDPIDRVARLRGSKNNGDIRTDIDGDQVVKTFAIYAFSDDPGGVNAMKWIGMYGAFEDKRNCPSSNPNLWPYPRISDDFGSHNTIDTSFNITQCTGASPNECCKEWDDNGDGLPDGFFNVMSGSELEKAVTQVLDKIQQATSAASAVATTSQRLTYGDIVVRGMFEVSGRERLQGLNAPDYLWFGHLEVYWPFELSNGEMAYDFDLGTEMCFELGTSRHCWDGAEILKNDANRHNNRYIFTYATNPAPVIGGGGTTNRRDFVVGAIDENELALPAGATQTDADILIKWVQGDSVTPEVLSTYRVRGDDNRGKGWCVGDIVYSTPVIVEGPRLGAVSKRFYDKRVDNSCVTYADYLIWRSNGTYADSGDTGTAMNLANNSNKVKNRDKMVYVGANDGMLHAFVLEKCDTLDSQGRCEYVNDPSSDFQVGKELWAYIPSSLLTELQYLASKGYGTVTGCAHRTMVDLAPEAYEMFFSDGTWRTILLGGQRGGGDTYFAIDVTNPRNPKILWEYKVGPDMAMMFDTNAALDAFKTDCGNINYKLDGWTPPGACETPQIPDSWFNPNPNQPRCEGCLNDPDPNTSCLAILNHYYADYLQYYQPLAIPEVYEKVKTHFMSWTKPSIGRLKWPEELSICTGDPKRGKGGECGVNCDMHGQNTDALIAAHPFRNVAFMGVGLRPTQGGIIDPWPDTWPQFLKDGFGANFMKPFIVALDMELGINLFRYVWPEITLTVGDTFFKKVYAGCGSNKKVCVKGESESGCTSPLADNCVSEIPYTLADMAALDLFKGIPSDSQVISDGIDPTGNPVCLGLRARPDGLGEDDFTDTIYVGDLNGTFYRIAINFDQTINVSGGDKNLGVRVDLWHTKPVYSADEPTNVYRGERQPIASRPAISYDLVEDAVRIVFGTGKYEAVSYEESDKTDAATMSLYNLKDVLDPTTRTIDIAQPYSGTLSLDTKFKFQVVPHCLTPQPTYRCINPNNSGDGNCSRTGESSNNDDINSYGCSWVKQDTKLADCCESDCDTACWTCIFDLIGPGERVVNKPIIAGQLVFVTTLETDMNPCAGGGYGYLYIFDYMCRLFPEGFDPTVYIDEDIYPVLRLSTTSGSDDSMFGARVSLGEGVPSQPVLDSTGDNLLIQKSDGSLIKLKPKLLSKPVRIKGWLAQE